MLAVLLFGILTWMQVKKGKYASPVSGRRSLYQGLSISVALFAIPRMVVTLAAVSSDLLAADTSPPWIWTPQHQQGKVPLGSVFFRKTFNVASPQSGRIEIAADDLYDLYVNGAKVASGEAWRHLDSHEISRWLVPGRNVVAVRVTNRENAYAGLAARIVVQQDQRESQFRTDPSWRVSVSPLPLWQVSQFNDFRWQRAQVLGDDAAGAASAEQNEDDTSDTNETEEPVDVASESPATPEPVADPAVEPPSRAASPPTSSVAQADPAAKPSTSELDRPTSTTSAPSVPLSGSQKLAPFTPVAENAITRPRDFVVEQIACHEQTGSLIAMTFNEFGDLVASQEQGPLLLIYDSDGDGAVDAVRTFCDKMKNCQGVLALSGDVYAVGEGPQGAGLYRLHDEDRDGSAEQVTCLVPIEQEKLEHGAHGLALGHDGMIYVMLGNHAKVAKGYAATSPYRNYYEGDLIQPRYEDPSGHAMGVHAPGGAIIRTDLQGNQVEIVAGGLRNPYDLAFNAAGDLFTHDADMEADIGTPWYRPTRVNHVTAGAEFGWRSGWAKWPDYFFDSLPAICDTGRGSPAGLVFYEHTQFPVEYQNALFSCDWSEGRIWAIKLRRNGASYEGTSEVFLQGKPLNATDIEVGPDGGLYLITGGRGTQTFLYRVRYTGVGSQSPSEETNPVLQAIRQPQPSSAWARQKIATVQHDLGDRWNTELEAIVRDGQAQAADRAAALRTMGWYGPPPSNELLIELSRSEDPILRSAVCAYLGPSESDPNVAACLSDLTADSDAHVRRRAFEALLRGGHTMPANRALRALATTDRFESWSARRWVESLPAATWQDMALKSDVPREFMQLSLARLVAAPDKPFAMETIAKISEFLNDYVNDRDFVDMTRLMQVALIRGSVTAQDMPRLGEIVAEEFPANNPVMNRELLRVLAYLREPSVKHRYLQYLDTNLTPADRLHTVAHLKFIESIWNTEDKIKLLRAIHRDDEEGQPLTPYIQNIGRDLAAMLTPDERRMILAGGSVYPEAALAVLYELPAELSEEQIQDLQILDRRLINITGQSADRLRAGIVAVLARNGSDKSMKYLRDMYDRDVDRRPTIAIGLAQKATGDNWSYLLRSLPLLDEPTSREILQQLASSTQKPNLEDKSSAELYHHVVEVASKTNGETADAAIALLEKWQSVLPRGSEVTTQQAAAQWRQWYNRQYPQGPPLSKITANVGTHTLESLATYLQHHPVTAEAAQRGAALFESAQCSKCHRFAGRGESMGPDLTQVAQRFTSREILESILEPSRVISDQYAAKTIVDASGKSHSGIVGSGGRRDFVVLKSDGSKVRIPRDEVEEIVPSSVSVMPTGLLDRLTPGDVHALVSYLSHPAQPSTRMANRPGRTSRLGR